MINILFCNAVILTAIWFVLLPAPAHAYFDIGTGTYMLQLIFGFGAAFWLSIKSSFAKRRKSSSSKAMPEGKESPAEHVEA